jgi:hypothetical protein
MKRNYNSFSFFKLTTPHSGAHPPPTTLRGVVRTGALGLTGVYAMNRVHAQPGSRIKERIIVDIGVFLLNLGVWHSQVLNPVQYVWVPRSAYACAVCILFLFHKLPCFC